MDELVLALAHDFRAQFDYINTVYEGEKRALAHVVQCDAVASVANHLAQYTQYNVDELKDLFTP